MRQSDWQSRCCATHRGPTGPERPTTRPSTLRAGRGRGRARILTKRAINSPRWERRRSGENPQRGPTGPGRPTMRPSPLRAGRGRHGPNHGRRLSALGEEAPKLWVVAILNGVCRIERELTLGRERMLRSELKGKKTSQSSKRLATAAEQSAVQINLSPQNYETRLARKDAPTTTQKPGKPSQSSEASNDPRHCAQRARSASPSNREALIRAQNEIMSLIVSTLSA